MTKGDHINLIFLKLTYCWSYPSECSAHNILPEKYSKNQTDSMICTNFAKRVSLKWFSGKYKRIIPLGRNNVPIVRTNPGYNNLLNSTVANLWLTQAIKAYKAFIAMLYKLGNKHQHISTPSTIDDNMEYQPRINRCDPEEDPLLWYQRFLQMPFECLQHKYKIGHLRKRLSGIKQPKCNTYMLGKASNFTNITKPGERVSVDHMESSTPELIAQVKVIRTTKRYKLLYVERTIAIFYDLF
jgi:hypothetical protein